MDHVVSGIEKITGSHFVPENWLSVSLYRSI